MHATFKISPCYTASLCGALYLSDHQWNAVFQLNQAFIFSIYYWMQRMLAIISMRVRVFFTFYFGHLCYILSEKEEQIVLHWFLTLIIQKKNDTNVCEIHLLNATVRSDTLLTATEQLIPVDDITSLFSEACLALSPRHTQQGEPVSRQRARLPGPGRVHPHEQAVRRGPRLHRRLGRGPPLQR